MKGAIIGDIIGSTFKDIDLGDTDFQLFKPDSAYTDDTILTIATADSVLNKKDYEQTLKEWVRAFPRAGYRPEFLEWALADQSTPYISKGEGAARRISPIGFAAQSVEEALIEAEKVPGSRTISLNVSKLPKQLPQPFICANMPEPRKKLRHLSARHSIMTFL